MSHGRRGLLLVRAGGGAGGAGLCASCLIPVYICLHWYILLPEERYWGLNARKSPNEIDENVVRSTPKMP